MLAVFAASGYGSVAHTRAGQVGEAESAYLEGIRVAQSRLGDGHPVYASLLRNYASFARRNGRKDATELMKRADEVTREQALRSGSYSTVDVSAFVGSDRVK